MDREKLINGYKHVLNYNLFTQAVLQAGQDVLETVQASEEKGMVSRLELWHIWAFFRSMWFLGITDRGRWHYWKFIVSTILRRPRSFPISMTFAIYGFHFRTVVRKYTGASLEDVPA